MRGQMNNWKSEIAKFDKQVKSADLAYSHKKVSLDADDFGSYEQVNLAWKKRNIVKKEGKRRLSLKLIEFIRQNKGKHFCKVCSKDLFSVEFDAGKANHYKYNSLPQFCSPKCQALFITHRYNERWSKKYDRCVLCGSREHKHHSFGRCCKCFSHQRYLKENNLWENKRRKGSERLGQAVIEKAGCIVGS